MYVFTQPFHNELDTTQGQFLSGVKLVLFRNLYSSRPAAKLILKNPVYPTIFL